MRSILHSLVLAPIVLAAVALTPNTAKAAAVVTVPFNFIVDGKVCPAGQYTVDRDPIKNAIYKRSEKAPVAFHWFMTPGDDNRQPNNVTLHFNQNDQSFSLHTVEFGRMTTPRIDHKSKRSAHDLERTVQGQGQ